jgi:hypothetical protein
MAVSRTQVRRLSPMADYMSKAEFSRVIARMNELRDADKLELLEFMQGDMEMFGGFGLYGFEPVTCTLDQLAKLIGYQCIQFNGELCAKALDEIWQHRRKFLIVGEGSDEVVAEQLRRLHYRKMLDAVA